MSESVPVVLPCRFSGGGLSMQTTTSRVSAEGVFVRCLVSPKEGSPIELWLTLPGLRQPLEARGVLTERVNPGAQEAGFFVRFGALSPEARSSLDTLLRAKGVAVVPSVDESHHRIARRCCTAGASTEPDGKTDAAPDQDHDPYRDNDLSKHPGSTGLAADGVTSGLVGQPPIVS